MNLKEELIALKKNHDYLEYSTRIIKFLKEEASKGNSKTSYFEYDDDGVFKKLTEFLRQQGLKVKVVPSHALSYKVIVSWE